MRVGVAPHRPWPRPADGTDDAVETTRTAEELGFDHVIARAHPPLNAHGRRRKFPDPGVVHAMV
ncbi:hypothetical protein BFF78_10715 [Streptomyces fodineus]|uniref:Luciferase-like domain-containing protein n=1 Tax=Streptomyces fodineus TaxID=1904616 RepID=A0A1D7Y791_9ACTN|nr:hypothetical protein BFF78_10715 [Streptomyces fodineus]